ncbi:MAG: 3'-5' exoribonuclease [Methanobacteriota archaeon]|nr:MAG: 3'-5' exoribonuclease [Euryarchaeota archaeon]
MKHCMLDLETLSVKPNAAIISIGAVQFDPFSIGAIGDTFYSPVSVKSCVKAGLDISKSTVDWWEKQSNEAKIVLSEASKPDAPELYDVLLAFSKWYREHGFVALWGQGSDFDNVILRSAYDALGLSAPWKYTENRCYRTIRSLAPDVAIEREGIYHNALDDAIYQAKCLQMILGGDNEND